MKKKDIIVFGTGGYKKADLNGLLERYNVVAVADSNPRKQGFIAEGHSIISPEQITNYFFDYIGITSEEYYWEIFDQLISQYGIDEKKIIPLTQRTIENNRRELQYLRNAIVELKLENYQMKDDLIRITGKQIRESRIGSYWNMHTVRDDRFVSAQESYEYCLERFRMYPKFREFAKMDLDHCRDVILDYGCGPGNDLVWYLCNSNAKYMIGMDVSLKALKSAQYRLALHHIDNSRAELVQIEELADSIPLEDNSIDFINCQGVLMHTSDPIRIVQEFYRVLKKERDKPCASIMVYNKSSIWYHLYAAYYLRYWNNVMFVDLGKSQVDKMTVDDIFGCSTDGVHCPKASCWTEKEFVDILKNAGFGRVEYQGGYPNNLEPMLAKKYIRKALNDSRLEEEHKKFLRQVSFNEEGYPVYNGKICCIGGVYICYM